MVVLSVCMTCRFDSKYPICNMFKLFMCAVCQLEMKPGEGVSIHAGPSNTKKLRPWDGPFLCTSCQEKKEAMEGLRPSGGTKHLMCACVCACILYVCMLLNLVAINLTAFVTVFSAGRYNSDDSD